MLSQVIEEWNDTDFRFLALPAQKLVFLYFETKEQSCSSNCSLESLVLFEILTMAKLLPSFLLSSNQACVELRVGAKWHVCFAYIVKSKTRSKHKRVIQSDQDVQVCGIFFWRVDELLRMIYLSPCIFFLRHGLYIFFSFLLFFDMSCGHVAYLLWVCIFSLFLALSFFHTFWACGIPSLGMHLLFLFVQPISLMVTLERES